MKRSLKFLFQELPSHGINVINTKHFHEKYLKVIQLISLSASTE